MKQALFLLFILIPFLASSQKAKIDFQTTSHNFKTIKERAGKVTFDFIYKNTGNAPLILKNVRSGCGCATPEWKREPIAPGETGTIKVTYDPKNRPGTFIKSIAVNSNAVNSVVSLTIRGKVTPEPAGPYDDYNYATGPVKMMNKSLNLGNILNTAEIKKEIALINSDDQPAHIHVISTVPHIKATVSHAVLQKGEKGSIRLNYLAAAKKDWGFVRDSIKLVVNEKDETTIPVAASISEDFSFYKGDFSKAPVATFSEKEITLKHLKPHTIQTQEIIVQNAGKSDLILRKAIPSDKTITVNIGKKTIKPGKKSKISLRIPTGENVGKKIKLVQFITNDPENPVIRYKIKEEIE